MEKRVEEIAEEENKVKNKKSKGFTIAGISIWIIFAYFIIYSIIDEWLHFQERNDIKNEKVFWNRWN